MYVGRISPSSSHPIIVRTWPLNWQHRNHLHILSPCRRSIPSCPSLPPSAKKPWLRCGIAHEQRKYPGYIPFEKHGLGYCFSHQKSPSRQYRLTASKNLSVISGTASDIIMRYICSAKETVGVYKLAPMPDHAQSCCERMQYHFCAFQCTSQFAPNNVPEMVVFLRQHRLYSLGRSHTSWPALRWPYL